MMSANSLLITAAALVGLALAADKTMATLPLALQFLATMVVTFPASLLMKRIGRRAGFLIGCAIGIAGGTVCAWSIVTQSFAGFCVGVMCIGGFNAFGQYYRFAAADVSTPDFKSTAISLVMAGGVVAAFVGPNLARATRGAVEGAPFAGGFLTMAALYVVAVAILMFVRIPRPGVAERSERGRPLSRIAAQPVFVVAVLSAMVGYGVMNLVMTATPLAMKSLELPFSATAWVIQWHVLGMFAPSFVTGRLIRRLGVLNVMLAGAVLLAVCAAVNLSGVTVTHFWGALFLLGVGWNFLFVGATTLVTETYTPGEKAKTQGLNDLLVFGTVGATAFASGYLHQTIGWAAVNLGVLPWIGLTIVGILWLRPRLVRLTAG